MPAARKLVLLPAFLLPALPLAVIGALAASTRLLGDDFCSFYYAGRFGLLRSIWYWRLTWSGRYSAFAADWLASLGGARLLPVLLPLLLAAWLLLTAAALRSLLRRLSPTRPARLEALALAAVWLLVLLALTPDLAQSFLWWNGMRSYALPLILLSLYALVLPPLASHMDSPSRLALGGLLSAGLWFLSGGLSETFAVFQLALLSLLLLLKWLSAPRRADAALVLLLAGWAGAALSLAVIVSAPGNALRQAQLPPPPSLPVLWSLSWQAYGHSLSGALASPAQVSLLAGALLFTVWLGGSYAPLAELPPWLAPALAAGGFLLSFVCMPPAVYGYSELPPPRTIIIPFAALAASLAGLALLWGARLASSPPFLRGALPALALLLLAFGCLAGARSLYARLPGFRSFARLWDLSEAQILQARAQGEASVTIPADPNWAAVNVLNDNPRFWVNVCYSSYYAIPVFGRDPGQKE